MRIFPDSPVILAHCAWDVEVEAHLVHPVQMRRWTASGRRGCAGRARPIMTTSE